MCTIHPVLATALAALRDAKLQDGSIIDISHVISADVEQLTILPKLFVRRCYDAYFQNLFQPSIRQVLLSGSPGIGKSCFITYVIWRLIAGEGGLCSLDTINTPEVDILPSVEDATRSSCDEFCATWRRVFFVFAEAKSALVFDRQLNVTFLPLFDSYLVVNGDLLLFDVQEKVPLPKVLGRAISFCSPHKDRMHENEKSKTCLTLYMPAWSHKELERLRSLCFADISAQLMNERIFTFGGKPRYIFTKLEQWNNNMEAALSRLHNYGKAIELLDGKQGDDEFRSIMTVIVPDPPKCNAQRLFWASDYVEHELWRRFSEQIRDQFWQQLATGRGVSFIAALRGYRFENYCCEALGDGCATPLERLPVPQAAIEVFRAAGGASTAATGGVAASAYPAAVTGAASAAVGGAGAAGDVGAGATIAAVDEAAAAGEVTAGATLPTGKGSTAAHAAVFAAKGRSLPTRGAADETFRAATAAAVRAGLTVEPFPISAVVERRFFQHLDDIRHESIKSGILWWPTFSNLKAADGFYLEGDTLYIFQVTVSEKHSVKGGGIATAVTAFGGKARVRAVKLVFVVPVLPALRLNFTAKQRIDQENSMPEYVKPILSQWRCFVGL